VDTTFPRSALGGRVPFRALLVMALLVALVAASIAFYIGSQKHLPPAFGPAANGDLLFASNGDIYARDPLTGNQHLVIGAEGEQFAASYSPDGQRITFVTASAEGDHFMVANADGTAPRQLALIPSVGNAQAAWAPDSRSVGFIYDVNGQPQLSIVSVADLSTRIIKLDGIVPQDIAYAPPNGDRLLIRAREAGTERYGLFTMKPDGSDLKTIVPPKDSGYGQFTYSGAAFSPDGRTIAYNGVDIVAQPGGLVSTGMFRVHLVNVDGTNDRALPGPADPTVQENWPAFSPDGKSILVLHFKDFQGQFAGEGWIAMMPADGSAPARDLGQHFTDPKADTSIAKGWSPDGSRILLVVGSKQEVYSVDPASGDMERLAWTTALPDWQRRAR
jgi:Tol biopolymer transport system component